REYTNTMKPFKTRPKHPVIVLVDNDGEGKDVLKAAAARWRVKINSSTPFTHLVSNLYILPVPEKPGSTDTCIEDLFDATWLASRDIKGRK
ncbi:hypothetical protein LXJ59_28390, partial [Escherichia coli]|nr:hypothetical protein [Escherichia coli]